MAKKEKRFERVYKENTNLTTEVSILVDKTTRIQYLLVSSAYGTGMTPCWTARASPSCGGRRHRSRPGRIDGAPPQEVPVSKNEMPPKC
ncbi:MAG: DUF6440 family protein [Clostridiales bacterium]|nr:DUF6440 family protein [Clostridiales bacterium]